ncbi:MAG: DnaJ domain-containing protein [Desulfobacterales bacterium]
MGDDFYHILGVDQNAGDKEIKDAYRKLAFSYHPDRNRDNSDAAEKMKKVNEAYAVLSNADKRRQYDAMRRQYGSHAYSRFRQNYSEQDIFSGSDINSILDEMAKAFGFRGVDEIFREFYGRGYRSFEFRRPGMTARGFVFQGPLRRTKPGSAAPGLKTGLATGLSKKILGKLSRLAIEKISGVVFPQTGSDMMDDIYLAPEKAEKGGPYAYHHRRRNKKLVVKVPRGIKEGQKIRLPGMGGEGTAGGGSGDLYLKVNFKKPVLEKIKDVIHELRSK